MRDRYPFTLIVFVSLLFASSLVNAMVTMAVLGGSVLPALLPCKRCGLEFLDGPSEKEVIEPPMRGHVADDQDATPLPAEHHVANR